MPLGFLPLQSTMEGCPQAASLSCVRAVAGFPLEARVDCAPLLTLASLSHGAQVPAMAALPAILPSGSSHICSRLASLAGPRLSGALYGTVFSSCLCPVSTLYRFSHFPGLCCPFLPRPSLREGPSAGLRHCSTPTLCLRVTAAKAVSLPHSLLPGTEREYMVMD